LDVKEIINTEIEVEAYQDGINRLTKLGQELGFING
jgi:SpoU rRNA methylase family enzyme